MRKEIEERGGKNRVWKGKERTKQEKGSGKCREGKGFKNSFHLFARSELCQCCFECGKLIFPH